MPLLLCLTLSRYRILGMRGIVRVQLYPRQAAGSCAASITWSAASKSARALRSLVYRPIRAAVVYPTTTVDMHGNRRRCRARRLVVVRAQAYTLFVRFLAVGAIASTDTGGGHVGSFAQAIHRNAGRAGVAAWCARGAMVADPAAALAVTDAVAACGRDVLAPSALAPAVVCLRRRFVGHGRGCRRDGLSPAARTGRPRLRGDRAHR